MGVLINDKIWGGGVHDADQYKTKSEFFSVYNLCSHFILYLGIVKKYQHSILTTRGSKRPSNAIRVLK